MTRNEWIAETAREYNCHGTKCSDGDDLGFEDFASARDQAVLDADALEAANVAPWQTEPAPARDEGEAIGLVRRYVARIDEAGRRDDNLYGDMCAFLSRLDGKGGAK